MSYKVEPNLNLIPSDEELMAAVQARQAGSFDLLFERYAAAVRGHLLRIVRDPPAAEDLLQEVFLLVWRRADQWKAQGSFRGWLFRIATNQALNLLRSQRRRPEQPLQPVEGLEAEDELDAPAWLVDTASLGPDAALEAAEQRHRLQKIFQELPEEKRLVFRLVHQYEMSLREAADELGIPEGTAKSRLHYARQSLRAGWQAQEDKSDVD